jgi:hypothetical protein
MCTPARSSRWSGCLGRHGPHGRRPRRVPGPRDPAGCDPSVGRRERRPRRALIQGRGDVRPRGERSVHRSRDRWPREPRVRRSHRPPLRPMGLQRHFQCGYPQAQPEGWRVAPVDTGEPRRQGDPDTPTGHGPAPCARPSNASPGPLGSHPHSRTAACAHYEQGNRRAAPRPSRPQLTLRMSGQAGQLATRSLPVATRRSSKTGVRHFRKRVPRSDTSAPQRAHTQPPALELSQARHATIWRSRCRSAASWSSAPATVVS